MSKEEVEVNLNLANQKVNSQGNNVNSVMTSAQIAKIIMHQWGTKTLLLFFLCSNDNFPLGLQYEDNFQPFKFENFICSHVILFY